MNGTSKAALSKSERLLMRADLAMKNWQLAEAEVILREAVDRWPDNLLALHNLAAALHLQGQIQAAEGLYRRVVAIDGLHQKSRYGLSQVLTLQGRHREALPFLQARYSIPETGLRKIGYVRPEWRGESLADRRIVIFPEQGLGDQIQMARFAKRLKMLGAQVTWFCHPSLYSLLKRNLDAEVITMAGQVRIPQQDFWTTITDLPGLLEADGDLVTSEPYLDPSTSRAGSGVGYVTNGRSTHHNNRNRSLSPDDADLLRKALRAGVSLAPEHTGAKDFAETAEIIADLDLVVTVDTSVAHLAGAMGKSVWILIPAIGTDARWGLQSDVTPWYPSARLFRSAPDGSWSGVIEQIADAIG